MTTHHHKAGVIDLGEGACPICHTRGPRPLSAQDDGWESLRVAVFVRDQGCIVPRVDPYEPTPCRGMPTLDHVHERGKSALGMKAPDDEAHLVTVCAYHHTGVSWPSRKRDLERAWLSRWWPDIHVAE